MELAEGLLRSDRRLLLEEDIAGIHPFIHPHDRDPGLFLAPDERPVDRRRPPVLRQERRVDVDAAYARSVDDLSGEDLAEGRNDDEIRRELPEGFEKIRGSDLLRLEHGQAEGFRNDLDRRRRQRPAPPLGAVGLGDDADDGIAILDEAFQGRNGEGGRSHEEYARFGHVGNLLHEIDGIHIHLDLQTVAS